MIHLARRALLAALPLPALAQPAWPARPVRLVIPYGAGNLADTTGRMIADELARRWGQRVVPENVPGAGGALGVAQVARAAPDGYTLGFIAVAALAITPHISQAPYDPLADLVPIAGVSVARGLFAVNPGVPARSVPEFVAAAKARPAGDPFFYYSAGSGTVPHLNFELVRRQLDFPAQHVPYRTSAAGLADLVAGRVQATFDSLSVTLQQAQAGGVRGLFTSAPSRSAELPDVPAFPEIMPGMDLPSAWQGLFAPRGTPAAVIERVARDTMAVTATPEFARRMSAAADVFHAGPEALAARLRSDHARFGRLVTELDLRSE